jgi:hypothetical protein
MGAGCSNNRALELLDRDVVVMGGQPNPHLSFQLPDQDGPMASSLFTSSQYPQGDETCHGVTLRFLVKFFEKVSVFVCLRLLLHDRTQLLSRPAIVTIRSVTIRSITFRSFTIRLVTIHFSFTYHSFCILRLPFVRPDMCGIMIFNHHTSHVTVWRYGSSRLKPRRHPKRPS